jgi:hypothetical protein
MNIDNAVHWQSWTLCWCWELEYETSDSRNIVPWWAIEFYSNSDKCLKLKTDFVHIKIARYNTKRSVESSYLSSK